MFGQSETTAGEVQPVEAQADINIFTVASGLLYEVRVSPLLDRLFPGLTRFLIVAVCIDHDP